MPYSSVWQVPILLLGGQVAYVYQCPRHSSNRKHSCPTNWIFINGRIRWSLMVESECNISSITLPPPTLPPTLTLFVPHPNIPHLTSSIMPRVTSLIVEQDYCSFSQQYTHTHPMPLLLIFPLLPLPHRTSSTMTWVTSAIVGSDCSVLSSIPPPPSQIPSLCPPPYLT